MLGVNAAYYLESCLRMDHKDFLQALNIDLGVLLGDVGLWVLTNLLSNAKDSGDKDKKKKV